jgi:hypothetical protein
MEFENKTEILSRIDRKYLRERKFPSFKVGWILFLLLSFITFMLFTFGNIFDIVDKTTSKYITAGLVFIYLLMSLLINFRINLDLHYNRKKLIETMVYRKYKTRLGAGPSVPGTIFYFVEIKNYKPKEITKEQFDSLNEQDQLKIEIAPNSKIILKLIYNSN